MNSMLKYLKDYKKESILAPLFKLLEASFELFVPLVMAAIIDRGIANDDKSYILKLGAVLIMLGVVGLAASITAQFFAAKAAVGVSTKIRHGLFEHIESLSFTTIDKLGTSTLITRITSDINQVQNGINMLLRLFLRSPFIVAGAMIMAFYVDAKAAIIFVVVIPALSIVVALIMKVTMPLYKKVQFALDDVLKTTRENIAGVRVIRAFNMEEDEINTFDTNNENLRNMQVLVGKIAALMNPVTYVIINLGIMFLIWKGAVYVDAGELTTGQVIALINYMSQILVELIKLANLIVTVTKAFACANRIEDVFAIEPDASFEKDMANGNGIKDYKNDFDKDKFIEFENVGLTYEGAKEEALSDISFTVKRGQTVGIIGGTGSGKTSLVHMIPGFYLATRGKISIGGIDVKNWDSTVLREKIGIVMQKAVLFKGTIKENLLWGSAENTEEDLNRALDISQSAEFVAQKEGKLEAMIEQEGRNLSGGQRQRLTIARALARKPEILILDDSSSALDFATDAKLRKAIRGIGNDTTTFIVSQRTSSIAHADKIIVLDDGKIIGIGTHEQLLNECDLYREIHNIQVNA